MQQDPSQQQPFGATPGLGGRVIRKRQRVRLPNGQVHERRVIVTTVLTPEGVAWTEELEETDPLDDGLSPTDLRDILWCPGCEAVVTLSASSFRCGLCGVAFCLACRHLVDFEGQTVAVCGACQDRLTTPPLIRMLRKLLLGR